MVKVISSVPHKSVVKEVVCGNCGSTLEYVPADVKSRVVHDYGGGSDTYHHITCPSCHSDVDVELIYWRH